MMINDRRLSIVADAAISIVAPIIATRMSLVPSDISIQERGKHGTGKRRTVSVSVIAATLRNVRLLDRHKLKCKAFRRPC